MRCERAPAAAEAHPRSVFPTSNEGKNEEGRERGRGRVECINDIFIIIVIVVVIWLLRSLPLRLVCKEDGNSSRRRD